MGRTIRLTDEQAEFLERLITRELDEEFLYQVDGDKDTEYYKQLLDVYKSVLGKPKTGLQAFVLSDLISMRKKELEEMEK